MKTLKNICIILILTSFAFITGCSENLNGPTGSGINADTPDAQANKKVPSNYFSTKLTLKPGESTNFSKRNTGISLFQVISLRDCSDSKRFLEIIGSIGDIAYVLNCSSKGISVTDILITNVSSRELDVEVNLYGLVDIIIDPGVKDKKYE